jgi:hypothetical protein
MEVGTHWIGKMARHCWIGSIIITATLLFASEARAIVDMKSANYSDTWTDLIVGSGPNLIKMNRSYNSRSIFVGMFGFGWCSEYETKLEVITPWRIKVTECGGGMETSYSPRNYDVSSALSQLRNNLITKIRHKRPDLTDQYLETLSNEMITNDFMLEEFNRRLRDRLPYPKLFVLFASPDLNSTVEFDGRQFIRRSRNGSVDTFDLYGRLTSTKSNGGNIRIEYSDKHISKILNSDGDFIAINYDTNGKPSIITASDGRRASYKIVGDDLMDVVDGAPNHYRYAYDETHNLLKITFPDDTMKVLTYNKDKDWVTSYTNRKGCIEKYLYEVSIDSPLNHYWSNVVKTCGEQLTNRSKYEFFEEEYRGVPYLRRIITDVNGERTQVDFSWNGKPFRREQNGLITLYRYDPTGRIVEIQKGDRRDIWTYQSSCEKPTIRRSQVLTATGTIADDYLTFIVGDSFCQPVYLTRSDGKTLSFAYESNGRPASVTDGQGRNFRLGYTSNVRLPNKISMDGVAELGITYDKEGAIQVERGATGSEAANNILEVAELLRDILPIEALDDEFCRYTK